MAGPLNPSTFAELAASVGMSDVPRLPGAACAGASPAWDGGSAEQTSLAVEGCLQYCPCLGDCRRWLDSLPADRRPSGVVAGELIESTKR